MEEAVMQKPRAIKVKILMVAALLYPACGLAQISGNSGTGASSTGSRATTGIASDPAHISPPGINSLGTANSSGGTGSGTVGASMEPRDSRRIDTEIQNENLRIDSKINGICRGC
jgi:hypothetical protein